MSCSVLDQKDFNKIKHHIKARTKYTDEIVDTWRQLNFKAYNDRYSHVDKIDCNVMQEIVADHNYNTKTIIDILLSLRYQLLSLNDRTQQEIADLDKVVFELLKDFYYKATEKATEGK